MTPSVPHRRPLHTACGCRSFTGSPDLTGMIEATPEFSERYPNARFEFKKGDAKGIYRNGALEGGATSFNNYQPVYPDR